MLIMIVDRLSYLTNVLLIVEIFEFLWHYCKYFLGSWSNLVEKFVVKCARCASTSRPSLIICQISTLGNLEVSYNNYC